MDMPKGKVIITVAVNGAFVTKDMTPAVPYTPEEVAKDAYECYNEGAAVIHIHGREADGKPTGSKDYFAKTFELIRKKCDIVTNATTGGGSNLTIEERIKCLEAMPECASLNMGTMLRTAGAGAGTPWINKPEDIEAWAVKMKELGIKPEMECYSQAMFREVQNLIKKGLLETPYLINFVMGMKYQGAVDATPEYLMSMKQLMPREAMFNVTAVGSAQLPITTMGMIIGGNARVGIEDNIMYAKGRLAKSNAELVARTVRIARELNLEPCTPDEARAILGIKKFNY
ncbi:MAG: 3-keto-5-aminohexanoate cleavage protein [Peptococcaceae bacterium]|jgi:3-keto-5-aminohexanoate cleavage enzyme|nr:3-keto-5-aminohexanoate cleavage protein [Peptococcaceae bacterium]MDH7524964.1 3-keto-5-aminohexanoate cleavage protein [Peptococcaceae bacterium]